MPKVLITPTIPKAGLNILHQYKDLEITHLKDQDLGKTIKDVDAVIIGISDNFDAKLIDKGQNLRLIATYSVGYDHIDINHATNKRIYVSHTPGDLTEAVGEHCLALMMAVGRKVVDSDRGIRKGKYTKWDPADFMGTKFMGKTLGIIGLGRIGQYFARMAKYGLDMEILYTDIVEQPIAENLLDAKKVSLEELLEESDVISINARLTKGTHHMIGENQFRLMKPMGMIINTARGEIINEEALVDAMEEGLIAGAGLDVFENEPSIHPKLLKMNNVVLTSHIGSATREARIQMSRMVAESVIDVLVNNKPPRYALREFPMPLVVKHKEEIVSLF